MAGWFWIKESCFYFVCMAQQMGLLKIRGTVHDICFYKMNGTYYARKKSNLTGERVKSDPVFAETMRHAKRMGNASKIASALYKELVPVGERSREKYREVVGMVMRELATDEHKGTQINYTHELHESARIEPRTCLSADRLHELIRIEKTKDAVCLRGRRNVIVGHSYPTRLFRLRRVWL